MITAAALQMVSTPDVARNLESAARLVGEAARAGARLLALPEYFCLMGQRDDDKLAIAEADGSGPIQDRLSALAREFGVWLVGGTLPIRAETAGRVRNACCVYGPDGERVARYDKIHLFAFDNGREHYDESRVLEAGSEPVAFEADGLRVGLSICYDLRFPEIFRAAATQTDLFVVIANWPDRRQNHKTILLRARAIENQCYVLAAAQGGTHPNGRRTWGHSMVIDPWGAVLDVCPEGAGFVIAEVDLQRLAQVRQQLPALAHRRL
jgi:nitrilase